VPYQKLQMLGSLLSEVSVAERRIYLGIGSSENRYQNIRAGVDDLRLAFPDLLVSSVYETEAIGFIGDPFLNLVVGFNSGIGLRELFVMGRAIEEAHGRRRHSPKCSGRMLDIDILTYGDTVGEEANITLPRPEILANAYVLCPLAEIAGNEIHPALGMTYSELWADFTGGQGIEKVDFAW